MFGPHLTLDLHGCDKEKLADRDFIFQFLNKVPEKLGLNKFSEPQLTIAPDQGTDSFDRGGITGFVILVESHVSIHTFPADGYVSLDIFSCKDFNQRLAKEVVMKLLGAEKAETNFIIRGKEFVKHYPRSIEKAAEVSCRERSCAARK